MTAWAEHRGLSVCLAIDNIDTDQLIPARFMSRPRTDGYGDLLLHDLRRDDSGQLDPNFILNRHTNTSVIITGQNFGSGSSREAAVYALIDAGIRVVIAPSFADIFAANAVNNGLLPACINNADLATLFRKVNGDVLPVHICLTRCVIELENLVIKFTIDANSRQKILNGWDDIDLTLQYLSRINAFSEKRYSHHKWALPATDDSSA